MKKIIALILALVLCLSLCACGGKKDEEKVENPLLGKWTSKTAQTEATFEFAEMADEIIGTWSYYDYEEGKWGEFDFTVKEQTNFSITLLIQDGTLDTMSCWIAGDSLYMDGARYINSEKNVVLSEYISNYNIVIDGKPMPVYGNILLGMSFNEVEIALSGSLEKFEENKYYNPNVSSSYAYTAEYKIDGGMLYFYFDGQFSLIEFRQTMFNNETLFMNDYISNADSAFGSAVFEKKDTEKYYHDVYTWHSDNVRISLDYTQAADNEDSNWVSLTYEIKPTVNN